MGLFSMARHSWTASVFHRTSFFHYFFLFYFCLKRLFLIVFFTDLALFCTNQTFLNLHLKNFLLYIYNYKSLELCNIQNTCFKTKFFKRLFFCTFALLHGVTFSTGYHFSTVGQTCKEPYFCTI